MRVLSAMQPSGQLHLGNYFGSMKPNFEFMDTADESYYFIVDLHALTTQRNPDALRNARQGITRDYIAAGFDPAKAVIFFQSYVPQHTELMWILGTLTPMGLLERAVSFKDKVAQGMDASLGLFAYPVLMAADILLYDADLVPVGKDQKQHVEMTRDIAVKFNNTYGDTFVVPEAHVPEDVAIVPGIDGRKMSKSYGNTIPIFGDEKVIRKSIMGIQTDSKGAGDPKDPESCSVYRIHKLFFDEAEANALADEYRGGISYADAKQRLFATFMDYFGGMRKTHASLKDDDLRTIMEDGAERAKAVAEAKMQVVRKAVGLR